MPSKASLALSTLEHRYLTIGLANEFLCVPISNCREIQEFDVITSVPCTPSWLKGVLNLRGEIISVVDISSFLGFPPLRISPSTRMVVLEGKKFVTAVLADAVLEVLTIPPKEIKSSDEIGGGVNSQYAKGVFVSKDLLYTVLDVERLLGCEPMLQFQ